MKYYIANFYERPNGCTPSPLMDIDDAIELYFGIVENEDREPILCNSRGEEVKNLFNEIPGRHDGFMEDALDDRYIFEVRIANFETGEVKNMYRSIGGEFLDDDAVLYMAAIQNVDIPYGFRVVSVRLVELIEAE